MFYGVLPARQKKQQQALATIESRFKAEFYSNDMIICLARNLSFRHDKKFAFLHIDMNSELAEMLALEHLFDKVAPGGMIVFDDFGRTYNANQMKAELPFMTGGGHPILELPTGQGIVIKHA